MKRSLRFLVLLFVCSSPPVCAIDAQGKYTILSLGGTSCGDVVEHYKRNGEEKLHNSIWVAGYLTAVNVYVSSKSNIAPGAKPSSWDLWVFNYCSVNPFNNLNDAASALVKDLLNK